jgi:two-component sensor histidine kinase
MRGPHYVPFLSEVEPAWLILRRIHLLPDPRGSASTAIFNHRAKRRLEIIQTLQQTSPHQDSDDDDLSEDDLRSPHGAHSFTESDDDAAAMDMGSDLDYHDDEDHENSESEYNHDLQEDHDEEEEDDDDHDDEDEDDDDREEDDGV